MLPPGPKWYFWNGLTLTACFTNQIPILLIKLYHALLLYVAPKFSLDKTFFFGQLDKTAFLVKKIMFLSLTPFFCGPLRLLAGEPGHCDDESSDRAVAQGIRFLNSAGLLLDFI